MQQRGIDTPARQAAFLAVISGLRHGQLGDDVTADMTTWSWAGDQGKPPLNELADRGDFTTISKRMRNNTHLDDTQDDLDRRYAIAKRQLGAS